MNELYDDAPLAGHEAMRARGRLEARRAFLRTALAGTVITAMGCRYAVVDPKKAEAATKPISPKDNRIRLPPGQGLIERLRPMGRGEGERSVLTSSWRLRVHGEVDHPFEITYADLLRDGRTEQTCDVHCVTTWSVFDAKWVGLRIAELAERAGVRPEARHVIFEADRGYTANVRLSEALAEDSMVVHTLDGVPLSGDNGAPARALVPQLYFWKSAKCLTGIRFSVADEPGFWEVRGYNNHADPWLEERYA